MWVWKLAQPVWRQDASLLHFQQASKVVCLHSCIYYFKTEWSDPDVYWRGGVCLYSYYLKTEWSNPEIQACSWVGCCCIFVCFLLQGVYNFEAELSDPEMRWHIVVWLHCVPYFDTELSDLEEIILYRHGPTSREVHGREGASFTFC